jgi:hypothetical protein
MREHIDKPAIVRPAEDLSILAAEINREHEAGEGATRKGLEHFRAAGERLIRAKAQCGHGKWLAWLKANVRFSQQRASEYMRLAEGWDKLPPGGNLKDALRLLTDDSDDEGDSTPHSRRSRVDKSPGSAWAALQNDLQKMRPGWHREDDLREAAWQAEISDRQRELPPRGRRPYTAAEHREIAAKVCPVEDWFGRFALQLEKRYHGRYTPGTAQAVARALRRLIGQLAQEWQIDGHGGSGQCPYQPTPDRPDGPRGE